VYSAIEITIILLLQPIISYVFAYTQNLNITVSCNNKLNQQIRVRSARLIQSLGTSTSLLQ